MQTFIFDANFFINLYKSGYLVSVERLYEAFLELGLDSGRSYTTNVVFRELKSLSQKALSIIKKILNIIQILPADIRKLTKDKDPRKNPQDPDLSLVALGQKLIQQDNTRIVTIVTNDFKLNNFIRSNAPQIRTLPPSSFILYLINNLRNKNLLRYFKKIRQQIMWEYEVQYVMERRDTYNPREKLRWLVEKALTMAKPSTTSSLPDDEEREAEDSLNREKYLINRYLKGERLSKNQNEAIKDFIPFLNSLKKANKRLKKVISYLESDQFQEIIKQFQQINKDLLITLQISQVHLPPSKTSLLFELISTYLARFEFFVAISLVEIDMEAALEHFDKVLLYSLMSNQNQNLLIINYFKALTIFFNSGGEEDYKKAGDQFNLTQRLAKSQKNLRYLMLARFGEAISRFLSGEGQLALDIMTDVNKLVEKHLDISLDLWNEFGDNFYMIGRAGIAASLYREALEIAVQLNRSKVVDKLLEKLKKCLLAAGSYISPIVVKLEKFIDLAHDQDSDSSSYNEAIAKMAELNKQLYEEFPHFTNGKWFLGKDLSISLKEPLDVVDHAITCSTKGKKKKTETTFYCYSSEYGGIAVRVPEEIQVRVPESYQLKLNPEKKLKIDPPTQDEKETYFIRAIINVQKKSDLSLNKQVPVVYEKFFEI
ncbi:MAG: hypothetical protein ACTSRW_13405 [Candidatus Helarchaeota archaeon]